MRHRFLTADVFTDRAFGGNPLAVLPDAGGLDPARMQQVAREFNLSETVFVLPPDKPAHTRRLRIFTPAEELPFAGHPTVGTALVLATIGALELTGETTQITFEEGAGPVPVTIRAAAGRPVFAELTAPEPPAVGPAPAPAALADMLGLTAADLRLDAGLPTIASTGLPFLIVELTDAAALGRARLDHAIWRRLLADAGAREVYLVTRDAAGLDADFRARMFAPAAGITEDPATGSAAAAFAWLARPARGAGRWYHALRHSPGRGDGTAKPARGRGRDAGGRGRRDPGRRRRGPGQRGDDRGAGGRLTGQPGPVLRRGWSTAPAPPAPGRAARSLRVPP